MVKKYFKLIIFLGTFPLQAIYSVAICTGAECSFISNESLIAANLANPVLSEIYTKDFLASMAEGGVIQNINSSMMGGKIIEKNRLGLGYTLARSNLKPRDFYFQATELRELPTQGVAASPSFSYAFNLGHVLGRKGEWQKWNFFFQFFPYYLSETNVPFLKIKNTDVDGKVTNASFNVRYFPFFQVEESGSSGVANRLSGLSFGFGLFSTNQEILLNSYDRTTSQFRVDGDRRRWLGINELKYKSKIWSITTDIRYAYGIGNFSAFGGLGFLYSQGSSDVRVERYALISSNINRNDFASNPSGIGIDISRDINIRNTNYYGILGIHYTLDKVGVSLEILKNKNTESLNLGVHYYF